MAIQVIEYTGTVPNREGDSPTDFANNVYTYQVWINNFVPSFNASVDSINADVTTINGYVSTTLGYKNDTKALRDEAQTLTNTLAKVAKYKGDWVANYNTNGYQTGDSISYTDGNIYYSKTDNNLVEPTAGKSTNDWFYNKTILSPNSTTLGDIVVPNNTNQVIINPAIFNSVTIGDGSCLKFI